MFFGKKSNYPIGLDISDLSLKVVQLNKVRDKIKIQTIGSKKVPEGFIINGEIKDSKQVAKIIKELLDQPNYGDITSNEVITCLPETRTFVKLIKVLKNPNPIEKIISNEIENHIPMELKEIYYDWQIIKEDASCYEVLIGASPKNIVNQYTNLLEELGLTTIALEIEPISICRSLLEEEGIYYKKNAEKNYCILDLGAIRSSLMVYSKNSILFTVSLPLIGDDLNKMIANELQISYEQADKAKIICGLDQNGACAYIHKIIKNPIEQLLNKIKETIEFYSYNYPESGQIDQIYLSGGTANLKNIDQVISQNTGLPTTIGNSLMHISIDSKEYIKIIKENRSSETKIFMQNDINNITTPKIDPDFATAIGLALRGIFIE